MKSILTIILGFSLAVLCTSNGFGQDANVERNYNFEVGDILSSSTGTLNGSLKKASIGDDNVVGVFMGLNSNFRSDVVRSEGVVSVKVSGKEAIKAGDKLTVVDEGVAGKLTQSGMAIGTALLEPSNGMVKVKFDVEYVIIK